MTPAKARTGICSLPQCKHKSIGTPFYCSKEWDRGGDNTQACIRKKIPHKDGRPSEPHTGQVLTGRWSPHVCTLSTVPSPTTLLAGRQQAPAGCTESIVRRPSLHPNSMACQGVHALALQPKHNRHLGLGKRIRLEPTCPPAVTTGGSGVQR